MSRHRAAGESAMGPRGTFEPKGQAALISLQDRPGGGAAAVSTSGLLSFARFLINRLTMRER